MSAIDRFNKLVAMADRIRKRDVVAFRKELDAACTAAGKEPGANQSELWIKSIKADDALGVDRPRPPITAVSNLPPRVVSAQAEAYMRDLQKRISKEIDDADKC